ncbi:DUF1622 domain-containing protein [Pseudoxanthomonas wuyuanensis]
MATLEKLLIEATGFAVMFIDALVLLAIATATVRAVWEMLRLAARPRSGQRGDFRPVWLDYARWLVAALTLQIGADILESSIAPSWQAIAQLGAIAAIRTFLNYFLERDIREVAGHGPRENAG